MYNIILYIYMILFGPMLHISGYDSVSFYILQMRCMFIVHEKNLVDS